MQIKQRINCNSVKEIFAKNVFEWNTHALLTKTINPMSFLTIINLYGILDKNKIIIIIHRLRFTCLPQLFYINIEYMHDIMSLQLFYNLFLSSSIFLTHAQLFYMNSEYMHNIIFLLVVLHLFFSFLFFSSSISPNQLIFS